MNYLMGLDIGTSSVKATLVSIDGKNKKYDSEPFVYSHPQSGYVEISAEKYIEACIAVISRLAKTIGEDDKICGISECSASGNLLLLDKDNNPLTPIINWQDSRPTDDDFSVLGEDFDRAGYYNIIGWGLFNSFPLAQLCHIKRNYPDIFAKTAKVCMSTEYLNFVLTGKWGIGPSAGTPFYFIDQQKGEYFKPVLDALELDESLFPPVMKTGSVLGTVTAAASEKTGIKEGTPVILGTFDHPAGARGSGVLNEGDLLLSCGTSWVAFFPVKERAKVIENRLLCDPFLSETGGCWGAMFSVASVSARLDFFIEKYIDNSPQKFITLENLAKNASLGAGGLRINLYDETEITGYSKENIARAIMESVGYILKDKLSALSKSGISAKRAIMAGGPTKSVLWTKIIEEILSIPITVYDGAYSGALGAAMVAGIGMGVYKDEQDAFSKLNTRGDKK